VPRSVGASHDDRVGLLEHRFHGAWHDQGMPARRVVIRRHDELEDGRRERLGEADEGGSLPLRAASVLGDDDRLSAPGEQGGDLVELRWRGSVANLPVRGQIQKSGLRKAITDEPQLSCLR
jgi:hypothetical protein